MRRRNLIIIIASLLFITPFLGVPNGFQDIMISSLSLLIIGILVFSKYLEGSIIKPKTPVEFDESLPESPDSEVFDDFTNEKNEEVFEKNDTEFSSENDEENMSKNYSENERRDN